MENLIQFGNGVYQGETHKDKIPHGKGVYFWESGEFYFGMWKNGSPKGSGLFFDSFGGFIRSQFSNTKAEGLSKAFLANGEVYAGRFKDGISVGKWMKFNPEENRTINGIVKDGEVEIKDFDLVSETKDILKQPPYLDDWENFKSPISCLKFQDGSRFFGCIENGVPNGLGALLYNDLKTDIGTFKNGIPNGFAFFRFHNGDKFFGKVLQGKIKGTGILYSEESDSSVLGCYQGCECKKAIECFKGDFSGIIDKHALKLIPNIRNRSTRSVNKINLELPYFEEPQTLYKRIDLSKDNKINFSDNEDLSCDEEILVLNEKDFGISDNEDNNEVNCFRGKNVGIIENEKSFYIERQEKIKIEANNYSKIEFKEEYSYENEDNEISRASNSSNQRDEGTQTILIEKEIKKEFNSLELTSPLNNRFFEEKIIKEDIIGNLPELKSLEVLRNEKKVADVSIKHENCNDSYHRALSLSKKIESPVFNEFQYSSYSNNSKYSKNMNSFNDTVFTNQSSYVMKNNDYSSPTDVKRLVHIYTGNNLDLSSKLPRDNSFNRTQESRYAFASVHRQRPVIREASASKESKPRFNLSIPLIQSEDHCIKFPLQQAIPHPLIDLKASPISISSHTQFEQLSNSKSNFIKPFNFPQQNYYSLAEKTLSDSRRNRFSTELPISSQTTEPIFPHALIPIENPILSMIHKRPKFLFEQENEIPNISIINTSQNFQSPTNNFHFLNSSLQSIKSEKFNESQGKIKFEENNISAKIKNANFPLKTEQLDERIENYQQNTKSSVYEEIKDETINDEYDYENNQKQVIQEAEANHEPLANQEIKIEENTDNLNYDKLHKIDKLMQNITNTIKLFDNEEKKARSISHVLVKSNEKSNDENDNPNHFSFSEENFNSNKKIRRQLKEDLEIMQSPCFNEDEKLRELKCDSSTPVTRRVNVHTSKDIRRFKDSNNDQCSIF